MERRFSRAGRAIVLLTAVGLVSLPGRADSVSLHPVRDNTIYSQGDLSNGRGSYLFAGRTATAERKRRALLAFDIAGSVPPGSTITGATLQLHLSQTIVGDRLVSLHRVLQDWGEGESNAGDQEGAGILAQPGDATWRHTFFDGQFWSQPGGDFLALPSASAIVGFAPATFTWGAWPAMSQDVQLWLDHPEQNFGWILIGDESMSPTAKRFDSRDNDDEAFWPKLFVSYDPPAASTCGNGIVEPPEVCDDGNTEDGDGCPSTCLPAPVPSVGDWGLATMFLLLLIAGSLGLRGGTLATAAGSPGVHDLRATPWPVFSTGRYVRLLAIASACVGMLGLAADRAGLPLGPTDLCGALVTTPLASYLIHLWRLPPGDR